VTVPNPAPKPIPGSGSVLDIIAYIKWGALAGIVACFFAGLIAFTAGRIVDNRRAGNVGALMMIAALGGAILYAIGYFLIRSFTHSG
jgi:lipopolysaccharide export LptBFGC system permease protein LptF